MKEVITLRDGHCVYDIQQKGSEECRSAREANAKIYTREGTNQIVTPTVHELRHLFRFRCFMRTKLTADIIVTQFAHQYRQTIAMFS